MVLPVTSFPCVGNAGLVSKQLVRLVGNKAHVISGGADTASLDLVWVTSFK